MLYYDMLISSEKLTQKLENSFEYIMKKITFQFNILIFKNTPIRMYVSKKLKMQPIHESCQ